jgi:hypothetical protein
MRENERAGTSVPDTTFSEYRAFGVLMDATLLPEKGLDPLVS